jgi:pimeloyl-ACP methyl ester carboxylesterase
VGIVLAEAEEWDLLIDDEIPATLLTHHDNLSRPVLIVLHGFGENRRDALSLFRAAFERGFNIIAIDAREHGDRKGAPLLRLAVGNPFLFTNMLTGTAEDVSLVIDYLASTFGVRKFMLAGVSMGGMITYIVVSREKRINAAVSLIAGSISELLTHGSRMIRELQERTDLLDLTSSEIQKMVNTVDVLVFVETCPPTPLLILAGEADDIVPLSSIQNTYDSLLPAYEKAGASSNLKMITYPGVKHAVTKKMIVDVLQWLLSKVPPC